MCIYDDDERRKRDVKTLLFFYFPSSLAEQHNAGGPISLLISIFIIITYIHNIHIYVACMYCAYMYKHTYRKKLQQQLHKHFFI